MTALPLSVIRRDGGTQPRDSISPEVARNYAEAIADGAVLPSVTVFFDGSDYWLADGFHRVEAHAILGADEITVDVRQGTQRDAVLYSVGANAAHGLPRTNADKRRAALVLINDPEWHAWSDREIARRCQVSAPLVASLRPATENSYSEGVRVYQKAGGQASTMRVGAIGKPKRVLPPVAGRTPDRRPDASYGNSPEITLTGAALVSGFNRDRVMKLARDGEIPGAYKTGSSWYFDTAQLKTWMQSAPPPPIETGPPADPRTFEAPPPIPAMTPEQDGLVNALADVVRTLTTIGPPEAVLEAWGLFRGRLIEREDVTAAAAWLGVFATQFPVVEAERQRAVDAMLKEVEADVLS